MLCSRLLKSSEVCRFKVVICQTRFGFALRPFSNLVKEKSDHGNLSKFTEKEEEIVLDQLNRCKEKPLRIKISQKKLNTIHKFIEENNSFTGIAQLYELQGFEPEIADQICKRIIKSSNNSSWEKTKTNFLTPAITPERKKTIKTLVGIDVGASCVSWTKLDCPENCISNWHMVELPAAQEIKSIVNVYDYVKNVRHKIPPGDIYVLENNNWSILNPQMSLRNHVRDAQITAILTALLNTNRETSVTSIGNNNVFFMRALLTSRLFYKLIGNERVSSQQSVEKMFEGEFPEFCTKSEISSILKNFYFSLGRSLREDMCQSLLLTLACRELLLNNKSTKLKSGTD